jgi:uracil-DNA glycosylase
MLVGDGELKTIPSQIFWPKHPCSRAFKMIGLATATSSASAQNGKRKAEDTKTDASSKQMKLSSFFVKKNPSQTPKSEDAPVVKEVPATRNHSGEYDDILPISSIHDSWLPFFQQEFAKPYFRQLAEFLRKEHNSGAKIFPPAQDVFSWASLCPVTSVKVVILGQDPYHDDGQAHGLAFSVRKGVRPPPSLQNIWKELAVDIGTGKPSHGCLEDWAKQGVLLLNTSLTVRAHQAASHSGKGWETFTDAALEFVSRQVRSAVFILWGGHAQKRAPKISKQGGHLILQSAHPSPLSAHRGFFGCRHFSRTNEFLEANGHDPINWFISE